jgi:hypothetical protein
MRSPCCRNRRVPDGLPGRAGGCAAACAVLDPAFELPKPASAGLTTAQVAKAALAPLVAVASAGSTTSQVVDAASGWRTGLECRIGYLAASAGALPRGERGPPGPRGPPGGAGCDGGKLGRGMYRRLRGARSGIRAAKTGECRIDYRTGSEGGARTAGGFGECRIDYRTGSGCGKRVAHGSRVPDRLPGRVGGRALEAATPPYPPPAGPPPAGTPARRPPRTASSPAPDGRGDREDVRVGRVEAERLGRCRRRLLRGRGCRGACTLPCVR